MDKLSRDEELRALVASWEKTAQKQGGYSSQTAHNMAVGDCANALAEILARHDAQGEAVAWCSMSNLNYLSIVGETNVYARTKHGGACDTPLYLHPAPTSKREAVVTEADMGICLSAFKAKWFEDHPGVIAIFDDVVKPLRAALTAALAAKEAG